jgi:hypothetical protein
LSDIPGPDELVMAREPADADPYTILIAAISLSACINVRPRAGMCFAIYAVNSFCGVMGYP